MPTHIRTSMRNALFVQLSAALPTTKIYKSRSRPIGVGSGKNVVEILVPNEQSALQGAHHEGAEYSREIDILLVGYCARSDSEIAADDADELALQLETAIHADATLGGVVEQIWMTGTDFTLDASVFSNAGFAQRWRVHVNSSLATMNAA